MIHMTTWDEQADVVIVGSGTAGLSAAIEAQRAGASVLVLEKMKITGGNTRISDGGLAAPGNFLQRQQGIEDTPDLFYADMLRAGMGLNHPELVRVVAENGAAAIDWTRDLGVAYKDRLDRFGGHSSARSVTTRSHSGADLIKAQMAVLKSTDAVIRTGCRMTRLIAGDSGVCGVQVRDGYAFNDPDGGNRVNIRAGRAVILATGGFGSDIPFLQIQNPALDASVGSTNHRGATAEGLIAALKIQAVPVHLSWIQLGPWACADESGYGRAASFASYSVYPAGIVVDPATGGRIVNEWSDRRQRSDALFRAGHACVGIVDAAGAELATDSLQASLKNGKIKAFDNLADLADAYAIPPGRLDETAARYNQMVEKGETDAFGKPLGQNARPLARPPFYAVRLWPKVHYTPGGVGIDATARVIDLNGRPIPRFFAAGEVCGGIHGASRLGSCALTECIVFGRIAGQQAAALPPRP